MALPVPLHLLQDSIQSLLESNPSRPCSLPVPNPTTPFWSAKGLADNPLANEGSTADLPDFVDICIIGSGITGVSVAYHLANALPLETGKPPCRVVIMEARDFCSGATGRNGGHLTPNPFAHYRDAERDHGADEATRGFLLDQRTASEILTLISNNSWTADIDLIEGGHVSLLFSDIEETERRADYEAARNVGIDVSKVQWLDRQATNGRFGALFPAIQSPGHNLWPLKLVTKLYQLAKQPRANSLWGNRQLENPLELSLHTHTPVTAVKPTELGPYRWTVVTPRSSIRAKYIVHATNGYLSHLLPQYSDAKTGVVPTRGQVAAIQASSPISQISRSGFGANSGFEYWFPRPVDRDAAAPLVILGGGREATKDTGYEYYETDDAVINEGVSDVLRRFLPSVFSKTFPVVRPPEMEWTGIMGFTGTGDPLVGPIPGPPGQYVSAGYSGHGMTRAFSCAEVVVGMIAADALGREWTNPSWMPRHYLTVADTEAAKTFSR